MSDLTRTDNPLCPLQSIGQAAPVPCAGKLCAWWDWLAGFCSVFTGADSTRDAAEQISALTVSLEEVNKNDPASAANTDGDKVESMNTSVSYPTIAENGEAVNMDGLPERIKVTVSREDGSPVFSRDGAPQVLILNEAAPVLVIVRDGGTLTCCSSPQDALAFIEDLTLPY